jgi:NADH-quinone oxidoreductase subunit F
MADHDRLLGDIDVASLDDWVAGDGGLGFAHALDLDPDEVIERVVDSGLRGRGGAGFPTGVKWRSVRDAANRAGGPAFVVCNGAEGEPGTFKDRVLLRHNPYRVLEGVLIALYALRADQAFVAVKESFTRELERLETARNELIEAGWRWADRIVIVPGPEEYLFGEEKALLEVIEGRLPLPRLQPPYEHGLFASTHVPNPTLVNNVESYAHVTSILANGVDWFRAVGTDDSPGTMPFTVVGDVPNAGVYELPLGTPLSTLLVDIAGADRDRILAVYSGTSNTVITPAMLDTPLDFDAMSDAGTGMGSGGFVVYDTDRCIVKVLTVLQRFLAVESCGQCNACVLGTEAIWDGLASIDAGTGDHDTLQAVTRRLPQITDAQRCYLPTGSQLMVGSTLEAYWDHFVDHLGRPCRDDRDVPTPLIVDIEDDTGQVTWHPRYANKRLDWTYEDGPAD